MGLDMIEPEVLLQRNQFRFIVHVPVNVPDDDLFLVVSIEAAVIDPVQVHHRHVVPSLGLVVHRNNRFSVVLPLVAGVVVGGLALQDGCAAVRHFHKEIQIGQHPGVGRVLEHTLAPVDFQPGLLRKDAGHQILQQSSDLHSDPVPFIVLDRKVPLVVVEVHRCPKRGDPQDSRRVAAAKSLAAVRKPFFP